MGLKQDDKGATVCVVTPMGEKFFTADYVMACDGGGSAVRRSLCIPFEGHTWTVPSPVPYSSLSEGSSPFRSAIFHHVFKIVYLTLY